MTAREALQQPDVFQLLWGRLMATALAKGVPFADAEDLAAEAVRIALEKFEEGRGGLGAFCGVILVNLIKNHWRDRKPSGTTEELERMPGKEGDPADLVGREEDRRLAERRAGEILAVLSDEEREFYLAFGDICRELEQAAVAAAGDRLGLTATKAWDIMRRIQRKARRIRDEDLPVRMLLSKRRAGGPGAPVEESPFVDACAYSVERLSLGSVPAESSNTFGDAGLLAPDDLAAAAAAREAFLRFTERLGEEGRARLKVLLR